jgi:hypothetical protein
MNRREKVILLLAWIAIILPLSLLGYGSSRDSWLTAKAAAYIWTHGKYVASRGTGYPLFELMCAPLVSLGGWYASNLVVSLFGLATIIGLFKLADSGVMRYPLVSIASIAFLPVILSNSSQTIEFIPALLLIILSYLCLIRNHWFSAAVFTGLSVGFRPNNILFLVPILAYQTAKHDSLARRVATALICFLTALIAFSPVLLTYGFKSPRQEIAPSGIKLALVGFYTFLKLFGIAQFVILCVAAAWIFTRNRKDISTQIRTPDSVLHLSNLVVVFGAFCFFPFKPEYLLNAVPSIVLLLDRIATKRALQFLCAVLLSYNLIQVEVKGGESGERQAEPRLAVGYLVDDVTQRLFMLSTRYAATRWHPATPTVLMLGEGWIPVLNPAWQYDAKTGMYKQKHGNLYLSPRICDEKRLRWLRSHGFRLLVWRDEKWEYSVAGPPNWQEYVEVVDDLDRLFGFRIIIPYNR